MNAVSLAKNLAENKPTLMGQRRRQSFKNGGVVKGKKVGEPVEAILHVGERVLSIAQNKEYEKKKKTKEKSMKETKKPKKGSQEMKDKMAKLRAMKKK